MFMERFVSAVPIAAGWSADRKLCVTDADGTKYLLRILSPEKEAYKRLEFQMMERQERWRVWQKQFMTGMTGRMAESRNLCRGGTGSGSKDGGTQLQVEPDR